MQAPAFYDIYDYEYVSFWQSTEGLVSIGLIILLSTVLIAYGIWVIIQRRRAAKLNIMPWDHALAELAKLSAKSPTSKAEVKQFYFALTTLIKVYLHKRFTWEVEDKTDSELIAYLRNVSFDQELRENLERLLGSVVEVKFADAQTVKEYVERDIAVAHTLITRTIPEERQ